MSGTPDGCPLRQRNRSALRRLKHDQRVHIHLDSEEQAVGCRVASVQAGVATLTRIGELPAELLDKLTPGALGYLLFEHRGAMTALKGIATIGPDAASELAFVVIDGVQLPERRSSERVRLSAVARVATPDGDGNGAPIEAVAANVSAGGVLLERPAGLGEGPRYQLELTLAGDDAPIRCDATVARATATHIALKFTDIQDADRIRLAGMIRHQTLRAA
jgi:PilZ domain